MFDRIYEALLNFRYWFERSYSVTDRTLVMLLLVLTVISLVGVIK